MTVLDGDIPKDYLRLKVQFTLLSFLSNSALGRKQMPKGVIAKTTALHCGVLLPLFIGGPDEGLDSCSTVTKSAPLLRSAKASSPRNTAERIQENDAGGLERVLTTAYPVPRSYVTAPQVCNNPLSADMPALGKGGLDVRKDRGSIVLEQTW